MDKKDNVTVLNEGVLFEKAIEMLDNMKPEEAYKYFKRIYETDPNHPIHALNLAGVLSELGKFEESNQYLQEVLDKAPVFKEAHFFKANNFAWLGDYETAQKECFTYLKLEPNGEFSEEAQEMLDDLQTLLSQATPQVSKKRKFEVIDGGKN